jgi:hypothetical protein
MGLARAREFGLDVIALVGALRYQQQRSIPQIHEELQRRGLQVAERTVTNQLYRYEELLALHLADETRLRLRLKEHKQVILALELVAARCRTRGLVGAARLLGGEKCWWHEVCLERQRRISFRS